MTEDRAAPDARIQGLLTAMERPLRAFLRRLAPTEIDDLHQETLARAWRSRHTFDPTLGSGRSWLLRIGFRAFLDARDRRSQPTDELPDHLAASTADPATWAAARDDAAVLLQRLPPQEREILLRFHRDGESIAGIAVELRIPAGTVKSHLHRARNRLWAAQRNGEDR
ncbi:MAG: sigma-70 family RNA polymerase sigma factor [bacterium]|nr:sigma-70 family RNA polymerase sigma factor [bacterium]